jgi:hypothetical protein
MQPLNAKPGSRKKLRQRDAGPNLGEHLFEGLKVIEICAFARPDLKQSWIHAQPGHESNNDTVTGPESPCGNW